MAFSDIDEDAAFFSHAQPIILGKRKRATKPGDAAPTPEILALSSESSESSASEAEEHRPPVLKKGGLTNGKENAIAREAGSPSGSSPIKQDNYFEISSDDATEQPGGRARANNGKKKKVTQAEQKHRRMSLTPPPEPSGTAKLRAAERAAQARRAQRHRSPDVSVQTNSPPELMTKSAAELAFEKEVAQRVRSREALTRSGMGSYSLSRLQEDHDDEEAPIEVLVRGVYVQLPEEANQSHRAGFQLPDPKKWEQMQRFKLKRSTPLRIAKVHFCGQCNITDQQAEQHIVMAYGSVQLFRSISCAALGFHANEKAMPLFDLYTRQGWQYVCDNPEAAKALREQSARLLNPDAHKEDGDSAQSGENGEAEEEEGRGHIVLILRGKGNVQLKIKTTASTLVKKLVEAWRQKEKLAADVKIRLMVEGDALSPNTMIGDADVETGDTVDVQVG
ncbi:hypothetical protein BCR37DRAFT_375404 [Protomyces lactucae-debilis]|uniref:Rad60/SUMO-like domain-containing protein n=1 Tax=Protomyces lactucae-debilis TaxID=2754530 RepID=A0A1Y2FU55_PROLT|nr:uncharacterized protein BCR37DRAFT_375404 [Protomyces lactucae-debilis]ORY87551.1 hypothetical protein BCR37DRAFT_375404 [Protomyces lactucae-debilis]